MVGASAQGVRLLRSKLRYHAQDFSYANFSLVRGRDIWRITSAGEAEGSLVRIRVHAQYRDLYARVLSLLRRVLAGEEKHERLFDAVASGFDFLLSSGLEGESLRSFECVMVLRILHLLGYIGKAEELEAFLNSEWSGEVIAEAQGCTKRMVAEINRALQESQL